LRRTALLMLILGILTAAAGCSLFRYSHNADSPPQTRRMNTQAPQVVRGRVLPACPAWPAGRRRQSDRPQNAPYIKRIKVRVKIKPYMYTYQVAWSATTDQFVLTSVNPKVNPPHIRRIKPLERAHKVRLAITLPGSKVRMQKETIHFPFGSAAISRSQQMKLRRVAARIKKHHGQKVSVTGYTCWIGPKKVNDKLALARAMAVVHKLGNEGVKVLSVSSSGKCCYIDLKNAAPNRRAEISWEESLPGRHAGGEGR